MKEITKTITRKYNEQGQLVEEVETTIEREYQDTNYYPNIPVYPISPINPFLTPTIYSSTESK